MATAPCTVRRICLPFCFLALATANLIAAQPARADAGGTAAQRLVARLQGHVTVPQVRAGTVPMGAASRTAAARFPQHVRDPAALAHAKTNPSRNSPVPVQAGPSGLATPTAATPPLLSGFAGATRAGDISAFPGPRQDVNPPDDTLAVSSTAVAEVVNSSLWVTDKAGIAKRSADLSTMFGQPAVGDPRILYDADTNSWFMSVLTLQFDANGGVTSSVVYVAVAAKQSDPTTWQLVPVQFFPGVVQDQPKLGYSGDKVLISFSDFDLANNFSGQETWALQKSDLVAGNPVAMTSLFGRDTQRFALAPAQALSSTSDAFAVYNNADRSLVQNQSGPTLGVLKVVGTPRTALAVYEADPQTGATEAPPSADQGAPVTRIDTGDDRLLGAVWLNGLLWTTANVACTVAHAVVGVCSRFIEAQVSSGGTVVIGQEWNIQGGGGTTGTDLYYASATFTSAGDMIASATGSGGSDLTHPSAVVVGQAHGYTGGPSFISAAQSGTTYYQDSSGVPPCAPCVRWGDYSGAAYDPSDPHGAWTVGEYMPTQPGPSIHNDWGTWIEDVSAAGVPPPGGGYTLDGYGGVHPIGDSPPVTTNGSWPGWDIARALEVNPCDPSGQTGWVLEGLGGLHPFAATGQTAPPAVVSFYTGGWDIARDVTATCVNNHPEGCVLDGWGGLHPWADSSANWPSCVGTAFYPGWDITRKLSVVPGTTCGFVLDRFGGLHSFNGAQAPNPPAAYWGWDIAADVIATGSSCSTTGGYTLDGYGGTHPFGTASTQPLPISAYWPGWYIARGLTLAAPGHPGGYTLDGFDGIHPAGGATPLATTAYTPGLSIARDIVSAP